MTRIDHWPDRRAIQYGRSTRWIIDVWKNPVDERESNSRNNSEEIARLRSDLLSPSRRYTVLCVIDSNYSSDDHKVYILIRKDRREQKYLIDQRFDAISNARLTRDLTPSLPHIFGTMVSVPSLSFVYSCADCIHV